MSVTYKGLSCAKNRRQGCWHFVRDESPKKGHSERFVSTINIKKPTNFLRKTCGINLCVHNGV